MMTRIIEFLIRVLRACCAEQPRPQLELGVSAVDVPQWDTDERGALLAFLRTGTGHALLLTLRHNEEVLKATACDAAQQRVDHARGRAVGYREAIASLILLSAPEEGADAQSGDENSVKDFVEQPVRGAAALRNQLSHES